MNNKAGESGDAAESVGADMMSDGQTDGENSDRYGIKNLEQLFKVKLKH